MRADFAHAAASYDEAAVLAREVGKRLGERLDWVRLAPRRVADIGCATGDGIRDLQARYPQALPVAVDFALPMLQAVQSRSNWFERLRGKAPRSVNADVRALPLASGSLDLAWSNLMLHWLPTPADLHRAFTEMQRVLAEGGLLHFAMFGPDTLKALRTAMQKVGADEATALQGGRAEDALLAVADDETAAGGNAARKTPVFLDMHDIGDMLAATGFADPVMEMELLTLTYRTPRAFLADQRRLGVRDGLLGKLPWRVWRRVFAAWEREDGLLPARFEIIYGHAWKVAPTVLPDGRAIVQFKKP
jgi:malonyl-CoA O-methyltransferase